VLERRVVLMMTYASAETLCVAVVVLTGCREDQVRCIGNGRCIEAANFYCNAVNNCGDWTDEPVNCSKL